MVSTGKSQKGNETIAKKAAERPLERTRSVDEKWTQAEKEHEDTHTHDHDDDVWTAVKKQHEKQPTMAICALIRNEATSWTNG